MDRSAFIYVDYIVNITWFPTNDVNPEDYLDNKTMDKENVEEVIV
jgi:hypothetical protein